MYASNSESWPRSGPNSDSDSSATTAPTRCCAPGVRASRRIRRSLSRHGRIVTGVEPAGELAEAEGFTRSFANHLLRLTLLAPEIQEAIIDGRQPKGIQTGGADAGFAERVGGKKKLYCQGRLDAIYFTDIRPCGTCFGDDRTS